MICLFKSCGFELKRCNKTGYCQKHRNYSPLVKKQRKEYNNKHMAKWVENKRRNGHKWDSTFKKFGISAAEYAIMQEKQKGRCAICNGLPIAPTKRLAVDHCHKTGRIRGLLCTKCNTGIGVLGDTLECLTRACAYLADQELNDAAQDRDGSQSD